MDNKIFIRADMEGITGVVYWPQPQLGGRDAKDDERQRKALAGDINAAIRGAWSAGTREIVVAATHGSSPPRPNLVLEDVDERASVFHGQFMTKGRIVDLVDPTYNGAFMIGMHAFNETADGILNHTFSSTFRNVYLNDKRVGEIAIDALTLGARNIPVALVTGDSAAVREAQELMDGVEVVSTKTGLTHGLGLCCHPEATAREIEAAAQRATQRLSELQPYQMPGPYRFEIELGGAYAVRMTDACTLIPEIERLSGTEIAFTDDDLLRAIRMLHALHVLASTQRA